MMYFFGFLICTEKHFQILHHGRAMSKSAMIVIQKLLPFTAIPTMLDFAVYARWLSDTSHLIICLIQL